MMKMQYFDQIVCERREALGSNIENTAALCGMSYKGLEEKIIFAHKNRPHKNYNLPLSFRFCEFKED